MSLATGLDDLDIALGTGELAPDGRGGGREIGQLGGERPDCRRRPVARERLQHAVQQRRVGMQHAVGPGAEVQRQELDPPFLDLFVQMTDGQERKIEDHRRLNLQIEHRAR